MLKRKAPSENNNYKYVVFVRNIDYSATHNDVLELMETVGKGSVKRLELHKDPQREDRHHGRARCEYYNHEMLKSAIRNINKTTFKGRPIYVGLDNTAHLPLFEGPIEDEPLNDEISFTPEQAKTCYQLIASARDLFLCPKEEDRAKLRKLCEENPEQTRQLVEMSILLGMAPQLEQAANKEINNE